MKIEFDPLKHEYRGDGIRVPSVSNCLDLTFGRFQGNGDSTAADHGIEIHKLCQKYLISFDSKISEEPEFLNFVEFCGDHNIDPFQEIIIEKPFVDIHGYGGTPDIEFLDPEKKWIVDIKTGGEYIDRHVMQLIAYNRGRKGWRQSILYLTGDTYKLVDVKFDREKYRHFLCAVDTAQQQLKNLGRLII